MVLLLMSGPEPPEGYPGPDYMLGCRIKMRRRAYQLR
jgi:hypothetical protein